MLKKLSYLFLFISIFSLQAVELSKPAVFLDLQNATQEFYDRALTISQQFFPESMLIPKKPITDESIQFKFYNFVEVIFGRSMQATTAVIFYNNIQRIEPLKNLFEQQKCAYLIAADINTTEQEIKDIFKITSEPTIIYYKNGAEIARTTNLDTKVILQYIKKHELKFPLEAPIFLNLKNLIQELYDKNIIDILQSSEIFSKFLPKKPITNELQQIRYLSFITSIFYRNRYGITAVVFYNNTKQWNQELQHLKDFCKKEEFYLLAADINKTGQEIKDIFKITTEPTIIYYYDNVQIARTTDFDNFDSLLGDAIINSYNV